MPNPETESRILLERHGFSVFDIPGAERLAAAVLGAGSIRIVPSRIIRPFRGELAKIRGKWTICLPADASPTEAAFSVFHELGHYHLGAHGHGTQALEEACDAMGAALAAPRGAFSRAVAHFGENWSALGTAFGTTCSLVALRYGEVLGAPMALVAPTRLRVRGEARGWHQEDEVLRLARTKRLPPEIRRSRLTDSMRRVLLVERN